MFLRDLREIERLSFPEMQLLLQILGHFPARQLLIRPNAKDPAFEELVIPERLREFKVDLSSIGAFLKPTQEMANYISLELARGRSKVPAYTPFIVPDVTAAPWAVQSKEHEAAFSRWRNNARGSKKEEKSSSIPMQAWLLYQIRFMVAADLAGAWSAFGGMAAQLNHLSIVMNISITESAAIALSYDRLVREFLAERARSRHEINSPTFFSEFLSVENPALKLRASAEHPRAIGHTKGQSKGQKKDLAAETAQPRSQAREKGRSPDKSGKKRRSRTRSPSRRKRSRQRRGSPKKKAMKTRR